MYVKHSKNLTCIGQQVQHQQVHQVGHREVLPAFLHTQYSLMTLGPKVIMTSAYIFLLITVTSKEMCFTVMELKFPSVQKFISFGL